MIEPLDKNISVVKPHQLTKHDSPKPQHEVAGKVTEGISLTSSALLSSAARNSLQKSFSRDLDANPYFPHVPSGNIARLRGRRGWSDSISESMELPSPRRNQEYVAKWN